MDLRLRRPGILYNVQITDTFADLKTPEPVNGHLIKVQNLGAENGKHIEIHVKGWSILDSQITYYTH